MSSVMARTRPATEQEAKDWAAGHTGYPDDGEFFETDHGLMVELHRCLNEGPDCTGKVELRMALSGTGIPYPRCDGHWSERLDLDEALRERYPEHPPSDWSPLDAGEAWGEDDY